MKTSYMPKGLYCRTLDNMLWIKVEPLKLYPLTGDLNARVGLTDLGLKKTGFLGDIHLKYEGRLKQGEYFGKFHGSKLICPLKSPVSGEIINVNQSVIDEPKLLYEDPYRKGWLLLINALNIEEELETLHQGERINKFLKKTQAYLHELRTLPLQ